MNTHLLSYHGSAKLLVMQHEGRTHIIRSERADERVYNVIVTEDYPVEIELTGSVLTFTRLDHPAEWP